jgi:hypothetical protein
MGVKFSVKLKISDIFHDLVPSPALQHEITTSQQAYTMKHLSDYSEILKHYLGWRAPGAQYTLNDFFEWISHVCQWCQQYPAWVQIRLCEGGLAWCILICFVNLNNGTSIPAELATMAQDMSIAVEDDKSNAFADNQLLELECHFLSGVYKCHCND